MSLLLADFASVLGLAVLAVPALQLNKLKRQQTKTLQKYKSKTFEDGSLRALVADTLAEKRGEETALWRLRDQICLYCGYSLLLLSGGYRLYLNHFTT